MPAQFKLVPLALCAALLSGGCAMLLPPGGHSSATAGVGAPPGAAQSQPAGPAQAASPAELDALFRLGRRELIAGRPRVAVEHFASLLDREPRHVEALNALGVAVAEMGRLPEAISLLRRAATLAPQAVHVRNNLGHALYRVGDIAQARVELHAALELQPHNLSALHNLALLDSARTTAQAHAGAAAARPDQHSPPDQPSQPSRRSEQSQQSQQWPIQHRAQATPVNAAPPALRKEQVTSAASSLQASPAVPRADSSPAVKPEASPARLAEHAALHILGLDGGVHQAAERRAARGARHGPLPGRRLVVRSDSPAVRVTNQAAREILGLEAGRFARAQAAAAVGQPAVVDDSGPALGQRPVSSPETKIRM